MNFMDRWGVIAALTASNFLWQLFWNRDFSTAMERSYFQAAAILIYSLVLYNRSLKIKFKWEDDTYTLLRD